MTRSKPRAPRAHITQISKLRRIRTEAGLRQYEVAQALGISRDQYGRMEAMPERITADRLLIISRMLSVHVQDIIPDPSEEVDDTRPIAKVCRTVPVFTYDSGVCTAAGWDRIQPAQDVDFMLKIGDRSMAPDILAGDWVSIEETPHSERHRLQPGHIVIARVPDLDAPAVPITSLDIKVRLVEGDPHYLGRYAPLHVSEALGQGFRIIPANSTYPTILGLEDEGAEIVGLATSRTTSLP